MRLPERWYRDAWLVVITGVVALSLLAQQDTLNKIQQSRVEIGRESCRAQNDRHDATIRKLDELVAALPPGPRKRQAEESRAGTVQLIEALAPRRDCGALVEQIRAVND